MTARPNLVADRARRAEYNGAWPDGQGTEGAPGRLDQMAWREPETAGPSPQTARQRSQAVGQRLAQELANAALELALSVEKDATPPNPASLVLLVEEGGKRLLLSGDAGDETLLAYLEAAGLLDDNGRIEVDVLKVPHHGAHNSFSKGFVERVRAEHYIFCGDGEHHNPEPTVVAGYVEAAKGRPLSHGRPSICWFNWSSVRGGEHLDLWNEVEGLFKPGVQAVKRRSLGKTEKVMRLDL